MLGFELDANTGVNAPESIEILANSMLETILAAV